MGLAGEFGADVREPSTIQEARSPNRMRIVEKPLSDELDELEKGNFQIYSTPFGNKTDQKEAIFRSTYDTIGAQLIARTSFSWGSRTRIGEMISRVVDASEDTSSCSMVPK